MRNKHFSFLKCLYANAHSMGNKQDKLEAIVQLENYDLIAITETWWDKSHSWKFGIEGYKLCRRDRQGRMGGSVAVRVKKWLDCEEFPLRNSQEQDKNLWVKIKDWNNKGYLAVEVYYIPADQEEPVVKAFLLQLREVSCSQALIPLGDFNHTDVCWEGSKQSLWRKVNNPEDSWSPLKTTSLSKY